MGSAYYTFAPPPDWQDVTAQAKTTPQFTKIESGLREKGATAVDIVAYASQDANVTIIYSAMTDDGPEEMLDGFDKGARGAMLSAGHEDLYRVDKTTSMHVGTQRISANGTKLLAVRYVGIAKEGGLTTVAFNCQGPDEATCDKALTTLHVDGDKFKKLSDLPSPNQRLEYAFGVGVGISAVLIVVAWRIYKSRRVSR